MTDTELALLRAIAAHPEEDTPRLAYADYLDETGGECQSARAEYIRIQVSRQRGLADPETDERMYRREVALYVAWAAMWRRELPGYDVGVVAARRGFWHRATAPASAVLAAADDPFARLIDDLTLYDRSDFQQFRRMLELDHVRGLVRFGVHSRVVLGEPGARALGEVAFPRLEYLNLSGQRVGDAGVQALCAGTFPALRELDLTSNDISDAGADVLLTADLSRQLRRLVLLGNPLSWGALYRLATAFPDVVEVRQAD